MLQKTIIINIFLFCIIQSWAKDVDCRWYELGEGRKVNYKNMEIIFLGIPISIDSNKNKCEMVVLEKYKGNIPDTVTVTFGGLIEIKEIFSLYLIYGNGGNNDNELYAAECSMSRNINMPPMWILYYSVPAFFYIEYKNKKMDNDKRILYEILDNIYEMKCRNDFYDELTILRALTKKENTQNEHNNIPMKIDEHILYTILLFLLLANIYLCLKIHKIAKKNEYNNQ
jgi:hypothetical protein